MFLPESPIHAIGAVVVLLAIIISSLSLFRKETSYISKVYAILAIIGITLLANHVSTYFASIFIIATAVTELEFLQNLAAIIRGDKHYFEYLKTKQGDIPATPRSDTNEQLFDLLEYKILNTLWTLQVNKWPDFSRYFTFRLFNAASEYFKFRENAAKLIGKGLVLETDEGQYYLSPKGWNFCIENHDSFPSDRYWSEEKINEENISKIVKSV